jgi:hypothetical protein
MAFRNTAADTSALVAAPAALAAGAQTVVPGELIEVAEPLRAAALGRDAEWLWLLDGTALPRPDTLASLLEAAAVVDGVPAPAILASAVVGPDGAAVPGHAAWHRRGGTDVAMRAARSGLLPIRAARGGSLLVRAQAARAAGPPWRGTTGPGAALEWTARILRDGHGYLVTASRADAAMPAPWAHAALGRTPSEDARLTAAMLLGGACAPKERLWIAGEAVGRAANGLRSLRAGAARP